jgi:hypothetical protein
MSTASATTEGVTVRQRLLAFAAVLIVAFLAVIVLGFLV